MISIEEALSIIQHHTLRAEKELLPSIKALNFYTAENIYADFDIPLVDQSAMDGYAIASHNLDELECTQEVAAGNDATQMSFKNNQEAIRIFTGAMCPANTLTVVRQEDVELLSNARIKINSFPKEGANVRRKGEELKKEALAIQKNTKITPAVLGLLHHLGKSDVYCYKKPSVGILITGNELLPLNESIEPGKIYESNGAMLSSFLLDNKVSESIIYRVKDNLLDTIKCINEMSVKHDFLVISGGISVGEYDYVKEALISNDFTELFYKVNQKPGKPLWYGSKEGCIAFALPGNPSSALTCAQIYLLPALNYYMGGEFTGLTKDNAELTNSINKSNTRPQFLKAYYHMGKAEILAGQSSAMLKSYTKANALVFIPAHELPEVGDMVTIYLQ